MQIFKKIKTIRWFHRWWYYTKLIWANEPLRTWRKLENGKYICHSDCGRYALHGICTCGLTHYFKYTCQQFKKIERDGVSWYREGQTEEMMHGIPYETTCRHDIHLNHNCLYCKQELETAMKEWDQ